MGTFVYSYSLLSAYDVIRGAGGLSIEFTAFYVRGDGLVIADILGINNDLDVEKEHIHILVEAKTGKVGVSGKAEDRIEKVTSCGQTQSQVLNCSQFCHFWRIC